VLPRVCSERAAISGYRETTHSVSFRAVVAPGRGDALLTASLVQDGGWSAEDGRGRPVLTGRAVGAPLLTLTLPSGAHDVRLTYRPPGLTAGLAATAVLAIPVGLALGRKRRPTASAD
jgi:uncharacterized membrane protein YfhO